MAAVSKGLKYWKLNKNYLYKLAILSDDILSLIFVPHIVFLIYSIKVMCSQFYRNNSTELKFKWNNSLATTDSRAYGRNSYLCLFKPICILFRQYFSNLSQNSLYFSFTGHKLLLHQDPERSSHLLILAMLVAHLGRDLKILTMSGLLYKSYTLWYFFIFITSSTLYY